MNHLWLGASDFCVENIHKLSAVLLGTCVMMQPPITSLTLSRNTRWIVTSKAFKLSTVEIALISASSPTRNSSPRQGMCYTRCRRLTYGIPFIKDWAKYAYLSIVLICLLDRSLTAAFELQPQSEDQLSIFKDAELGISINAAAIIACE